MGNDSAVLGIRWPVDPTENGSPRIGGALPLYETMLSSSPNQSFQPRWFSLADLLKLAWHYAGIITACAAAGLLLGIIAGQAFPRLFQASALLYALGADDAAMQGELSILRSDDVLHATVAQVGPTTIITALGRPMLEGILLPRCAAGTQYERCAASLLKPGLEMLLDGSRGGEQAGRVLRLRARFTDPALTASVLDAAIVADRNARRGAYVTARAATIAPQLQDATAEAMRLASEANAIRKEAGVLDIGLGISAAVTETSSLALRQSEVRERQGAVEAGLAQSRVQLRASPELVVGSREINSGIPAPGLNTLLLQMQLERAHMAQLYAPGFPGILELDRKIAVAESTAQAQAAQSASVIRDIRNPNWDTLSAKVASLQADNDALARQGYELGRQAALMALRAETLRSADTRLFALRQRQDAAEAAVRQLSAEMTTLRMQDTLTATRADELRLLQRGSVEEVPWTGMPTTAALGLAAGLLTGFVAAVRASRKRAFYAVAREAERHLRLPQLAAMTLWRRGGSRPPLQQQAHNLAMRILDLSDDSGGKLSTIHLVGTEETDGAHLVAHALAREIGKLRQVRVVVLCLGRTAQGDMQSVVSLPAPGPEGLQANAMLETSSADEFPATGGLIRAVLRGQDNFDGPLRLQFARLREMQNLVLVISSHGLGHRATGRVSELSDLDVMVLRARSTRVDAAHRLARGLAAAGMRPAGFTFTADSSGPLGRFLDRRKQCA